MSDACFDLHFAHIGAHVAVWPRKDTPRSMPRPTDDVRARARYSLNDLRPGTERTHSYRVPQTLADGFIEMFEDTSPVHVDDDFARAWGFHRRLVHGSVLNGFLSHFVGTVMPGASGLLLATSLRYAFPIYADAIVELKARIARRVVDERVVVLVVSFEDTLRGAMLARGTAHVAIT